MKTWFQWKGYMRYWKKFSPARKPVSTGENEKFVQNYVSIRRKNYQWQKFLKIR